MTFIGAARQPGASPACRGVSAPAFEIEELVCSIIGQSEEVHESPADAQVEQFYSLWNRLDERTQTRSLAVIINEVVFDPDAGWIVVTLVDDAAERIMSAKSNGSPTR
jgi:hypothetical protein